MIVGIDLSTFAIDLVKLDEDTDDATWFRAELGTSKRPKLERLRSIRANMPVASWWDDVSLVGIEQPAGRSRGGLSDVAAAYGAALQAIPASIRVRQFRPAEWRKACGLPGNCSKDTVAEFSNALRWDRSVGVYLAHPDEFREWPQDACDAYAIAYAARTINQTQELDQDC